MRKPTYEILETEKVNVDKDMPKKVKATVKAQGTGAYVRLPSDWMGKTVLVILE